MKKRKSRQHLVSPVVSNASEKAVSELIAGGVRFNNKGGADIIFPGTPAPQVLFMGDWPGRKNLLKAICEWIFANYRGQRANTRANMQARLRQFLKWLAVEDPQVMIKAASDISQHLMVAYLEALKLKPDKSNLIRAQQWRTVRRCILAIASSEDASCPVRVLRLPMNPFPLAYRGATATEPLTIEEVRSLIRHCLKRIEDAWQKYRILGSDYPGPTVAEMIPFLYVIGFLTAMNPDTLRGLKIQDISEDHEGNLVIRGEKPRARRHHQVTLPRSEGSGLDGRTVLSRVITMTSPLRRGLTNSAAQDVWLCRPQRKPARIVSFRTLGRGISYNHSYKLGDAAGVPALSLRRVRATVADLIRLLDTGVTVSAVLGNSTSVAETHYKSAGAKRRQSAVLAGQMEMRTRYVRTGGLRDVRDRFGAAQSAATPGYSCADPFSPPSHLNQAPGTCAAFLECPTCPLAGLNVDSPETARDLLSLRMALHEAQLRLPPARWRAQYMQKLKHVEAALQRMTLPAIEHAGNPSLLHLPELE